MDACARCRALEAEHARSLTAARCYVTEVERSYDKARSIALSELEAMAELLEILASRAPEGDAEYYDAAVKRIRGAKSSFRHTYRRKI